MTSLKQTLQADLTTAMRSGDADSLRTLRMVLTAISQAEVSGKVAHALTHDEEIAILTAELKRRRESADAFASAGRQELADAEVAEAVVISRYLPQPLTEEEVATLVASAVDQARSQGLEGGRAMGAVMKSLKADTAGRYDGAALAGMVKRELGLG